MLVNLMLGEVIWRPFGLLKAPCTGEKYGVKASVQGSPQSLPENNTLLKLRTPVLPRAFAFCVVWKLRLWSLASRRPRPGPTTQSEVFWR